MNRNQENDIIQQLKAQQCYFKLDRTRFWGEPYNISVDQQMIINIGSERLNFVLPKVRKSY